MIESVYDAVRGLPGGLAVFIVAMMPVTELRGAIPLGILGYKLPAAEVFALAVAGNFVSVPVLVFGLEPASRLLRRWKLFDRLFEGLFARTRRKHSKRFETVEDLALVTFVAIPLPGTGAWSGALAAFVFGIPPRRALWLVWLGVLIAGVAVTALVLSGLFVLGIPRP